MCFSVNLCNFRGILGWARAFVGRRDRCVGAGVLDRPTKSATLFGGVHVGADAHIGPRTGEDTCPYDALSDPVRYTRGVVNATPYEVYSDPGMNTGASHASPSEGAVSRQAD